MPLSKPLRHLLAISLMTLMHPLTVVAEDVPERSQVEDQYKWDLTDMYRDASAWEDDKATLIALLPSIADYRGKLGNDGSTLLAAIEAIQAVEAIVANLYVYAGLKNFEDTRISENGARFSEAQGLYSQFQQALAFFSPELLSIPEDTLAHYVATTPGLSIYEHYLDETARMRAYTLSEAEEKLLAMASDPLSKFDSVFTAIDSSDLQFGRIVDEAGVDVELTTSRYGAFLHSTDRRVRKAAWTQLFEGYRTLNHTLAANYEGHVKSRVFFARARGFDSRLQQATYTNAIPIEVFNNLITAVRAGSGPLQRYLKLRERALGVDRLEVWDMYAPIVEPSLANISFDEAKNIVAEALTPLGDEYLDIYWKGFDEGWVDAFLEKNSANLRDAHAALTAILAEGNVPVVPSSAGMFVWVDLSAHMKAPTWEEEKRLWTACFEDEKTRLLMTPGRDCRHNKPGCFRMCFAAVKREALEVAARRLVDLLKRYE